MIDETTLAMIGGLVIISLIIIATFFIINDDL